MLTRDQRDRLLELARSGLEARVLGLALDAGPGDELGTASGAFVSIHRGHDLRGCLGRLQPMPVDPARGTPCPGGGISLSDLVVHLARAVADSDPRFPAVRPDELAHLDIEISVLTPEREIGTPGEIEAGRHGVIVEQGGRRGLLLPQVATEHGWDRVTLLEHTCLKAGLPRTAWKSGARMFVFEAEVFGERDADDGARACGGSPTNARGRTSALRARGEAIE